MSIAPLPFFMTSESVPIGVAAVPVVAAAVAVTVRVSMCIVLFGVTRIAAK